MHAHRSGVCRYKSQTGNRLERQQLYTIERSEQASRQAGCNATCLLDAQALLTSDLNSILESDRIE